MGIENEFDGIQQSFLPVTMKLLTRKRDETRESQNDSSERKRTG